MANLENTHPIRISPSRICLGLLAIVGVLFLAHVVSYLVELQVRDSLPERTTTFFSLDEENNLPTWFSGILLFLVGAALAFAGLLKRIQGDGQQWQWFAIALIPFGLSLDEVAQVHEAFSVPVREKLGLGGIFYYAWVVPFFGLVAVLTLAFLPFVLRLPVRTLALLSVGAGMVFAGGMLLELIEAWWTAGHGLGGTVWFTLITIQESMELVGTVAALYAVLDYIAGQAPQLAFQLERDSLQVSVASPRRAPEARPAPWPTTATD